MASGQQAQHTILQPPPLPVPPLFLQCSMPSGACVLQCSYPCNPTGSYGRQASSSLRLRFIGLRGWLKEFLHSQRGYGLHSPCAAAQNQHVAVQGVCPFLALSI